MEHTNRSSTVFRFTRTGDTDRESKMEICTNQFPCGDLYLTKDLLETGYHCESRKCDCMFQREIFERKEPHISALPRRRGYKTSRAIALFKILSCCRTSALRSFRFCLYGFIIWTLVVGPLVAGIAQDSLLFKHRLSLGGATVAAACHPGPGNIGGGRPRPTVNLVPFQRQEFVPKTSEQTIGASGPAEGPIHRNTKRFNEELSENFNTNIVFRDEEKTNEDRMMTKRCADRLDILAKWVEIQWYGVKLRVTEAWDDPDTEDIHPAGSLHYEGRAVDITTSDLDRTKYPILARLAVEAGFDWVMYERSRVHCSVKSDSSEAARRGGCFPGDSLVQTPGGESRRMAELQPGDEVLSVDARGKVVTDSILTFMDVRSDVRDNRNTDRAFIAITTKDQTLRLTRNHLVYVSELAPNSTAATSQAHLFPSVFSPDHENNSYLPPVARFAGNVQVGQYVYVHLPEREAPNHADTDTLRLSEITKVEIVTSASGAYAPLTSRGTILVDGAVTSCYAVLENDFVAHVVMTPVRYYYLLQRWLSAWFSHEIATTATGIRSENRTSIGQTHSQQGILPYARLLYDVTALVLPDSMFWGD